MAYQSASAQIYAYSLIVLIFLPFSGFGQSYHSISKKAIKVFESARNDYNVKNYDATLIALDKALSIDNMFLEAWLLKAETLSEQKNDNQAIEAYEKLFEIDSLAYPHAAISLSKLYLSQYEFDKTIRLLNWYLGLKDQKESFVKSADNIILVAEFRKNAIENPVKFKPENLGNVVNSSADEYVDQIMPYGEEMFFTKRYQENKYLKENVFVTTMIDSIWITAKPFFYDNMGAINISSDRKEMYFTGCEWKDTYGSCDIYTSEYQNGRWSIPRNMGAVINTGDWESQACLSYDGQELYFVRRSKAIGTSDIYVTKRQSNDSWGNPVNLGKNINTDGNEMAPYIHPDGKTLYFSSDGHLGMGGYDLFVTRRNENGEWSKPINLGYPLNTDKDEINFVVCADAKTAYISAKRDDGYGGYDIYNFELDENFRPEIVKTKELTLEDMYEDALKSGKSIILKNIHFQFDSTILDSISLEKIKILTGFLISHPYIKVELSGHTDDMGDSEYNRKLSQHRADAVMNALIDNGITPERLNAVAYGAEQPLVPNDSDEHRAINRRVEMSFRTK